MAFAEKMVLAIFGVGNQLSGNLVAVMLIFRKFYFDMVGLQVLIVLWMTRSLTDDIPGWGALFGGLAGDGTVSVSVVF